MKITKKQLRKIIKEEKARLLREQLYSDDVKPGDYLEITISDDGYDKSVEKVSPAEYENTRSPYTSLKVLVRIEQVAEFGEDY